MSKDNSKKTEFDTTELENQTASSIQAELDALALEERQLDLEIKRETVAKIRAQRNAKLEEVRSKQRAIMQFLAQREAQQNACNHRKGGIGVDSVMRGQGTSAMYSIIKHKLPDGRYFILCTRCLKEWHSPHPLVASVTGEKETPGYREMLNAPTDNSPSGSSTFLFEKTVA
jgi:hypothetical protein